MSAFSIPWCARVGGHARVISTLLTSAALLLVACEDGSSFSKFKDVMSQMGKLAAGEEHTCVIRNGEIWCWGNNTSGELGFEEEREGCNYLPEFQLNSCSRPVRGPSVSRPALLEPSLAQCAIGEQGQVSCWGAAYSSLNPNLLPEPVGRMDRPCAVRKDGTVWCLADSMYFQDADTNLFKVAGIKDALDVVTAGTLVCVLRFDGSVWCLGDATNGGLGDGQTFHSLEPVKVVGLEDIVHISAGLQSICAVERSGSVLCWGSNFCFLDDPNDPEEESCHASPFQFQDLPTRLSGLTDVIASSQGGVYLPGVYNDFHTCFLHADGRISCLGDNGDDFFGLPCNEDPCLEEIEGIDNAIEVVAGWHHTCALLANGGVKCWGSNNHGQLGDGTMEDSPTPVDVAF